MTRLERRHYLPETVQLTARLGFVVLVLSAGCASGRTARDPGRVLDEYAEALNDGRTRDAYALLSEEAQKATTYEEFERLFRENPEEIASLTRSLSRARKGTEVTATVITPDGEELKLVYEAGAWRLDGSSIDLYSQVTPEQAITSFIRAFENKRYDILMRFVPDAKRSGLTPKKLEKSWEGEQKVEMQRVTQALKASLPSARFELLGNRATMAYGAGGTVELLREHGVWKLEDLK